MAEEQITSAGSTILSGWKEIARYLGRGVRTVQRWEQLGLPISRPNRHLRSAVCAASNEVDEWLHRCRSSLNPATDSADNQNCAHVHEISDLKREVARLNGEIEKLRLQAAKNTAQRVIDSREQRSHSKLADAC